MAQQGVAADLENVVAPLKRVRRPVASDTQRPSESIYLVEDEASGWIKIGVASNVALRIASLQTGNPNELRLLASTPVRNAVLVERGLHSRFAVDRGRGEWFRPSMALRRLAMVMRGEADPEIAEASLAFVIGHLSESQARELHGLTAPA